MEALQGVPEHGFTAPGGGFFRKGSGEEEDDKDKKDKKDKDQDKNKKDDKPERDDAADEPPITDWLFPP
jgi:hypothetical protein